MDEKLKILFLCTGNSCRSQMAEGWTKHLRGNVIEAYSAGVEIHGLNLNALKVMTEAGVDLSDHTSQHVDEFKNFKLDFVITTCGHAHEICPFFPGNCKVVHAGFDDPAEMVKKLVKKGASEEEQINCYRKVRDEIKAFVETLPDILK